MVKILIIEDEPAIQKLLEYDLKQGGYIVNVAGEGKLGYELAKSNEYDLILLDLMLPGINGLEICKKLRKEGISSFIIMLTALDDEFDKVNGLNIGADDYITKPFSPRELLARIKAVLRRKESESPEIKKDKFIEYKNLKIYTERYEVFINEKPIELTLKEFDLLLYLIKNRGLALSRDQLLTALWGFSYDGDSRIVDVHVFKLREKLNEIGKSIKTVRGIGYMLEC